MKLTVHVKPGAKKAFVKPYKEQSLLDTLPITEYIVSVTAQAKEGKANKAVVEALAGYFNVARSCVTICTGAESKKKIVEIVE